MGKKLFYYLALLVFVAYTAWMIGPYLQSVIVRDASVTTWSRAAVAPIDGRVSSPLPEVGARVGDDGLIVTLQNTLLLQAARSVEDTRDKIIAIKSKIAETKEYLVDLAEIERERVRSRDQLAKVFHDQLESEIQSLNASIAVNDMRLQVLQRVLERQRALTKRGAGSEAALDEVLLRIAEIRAQQTGLKGKLKFAKIRDAAAEGGIFITSSGDMPDWSRYGELEVALEEHRARHEIHVAEDLLKEAQRDLQLEQKTLAELSQAEVSAPPGSLVFSVLAAPDATLAAGDPIIEWIDCSQLLVDVPVSDAELPLIRTGASAEVVLEGEPLVRQATVHLTRGSTATLERSDLAAVAKGRTPGVAQVLLTLDAEPGEFDICPVGRAAYVEFPQVGLIDILRARLRL